MFIVMKSLVEDAAVTGGKLQVTKLKFYRELYVFHERGHMAMALYFDHPENCMYRNVLDSAYIV